jgi:uncharacterized glyoxalase superfamily metalloenzyme YdcJ
MDHAELRAAFAHRLSALYAAEVPAYATLAEVSRQINAEVAATLGAGAERLGSLDRVTEERHGAVRVGSVAELRQAAQVFAGFGMSPVGFYDLRDTKAAVPVVSTGFRAIEAEALARSPFRMFCSLLEPADRRFFSADLASQVEAFVAARTLFSEELLSLATRSEREGGLQGEAAQRLLTLATEAFALSREPVDRAWYHRLEQVSSVAADIAGVGSTHLNHLTPRVLDIDLLYARLSGMGVEMIERIQGPPRWAGPDVLLRQTSFRALAEPRLFREPDGSVVEGGLKVRFGEVECRGIALTAAGMDLYASLVGEAPEVWAEKLPGTETGLREAGLAWFTYTGRRGASQTLEQALASGSVVAAPIVYEDFLPRSAAGIFQSNLTGAGSRTDAEQGVHRDRPWLAEMLGRTVHDPQDLYAAQQAASLAQLG